ncbi:MAG: pyruvate carboxylase subunit B [SAR202 cluster bacterium]|jgi:pyruvate carboxylase subunit B|nr:pyruvate carboxylase subunit B [SAR202 cluster bacterium]HAL47426.1 carboxylase [Dehalococcoidia bacterium]MDP6662969.1 pyruvate carboxylase subunit B [SAR202 cluster bacterium]MDP6798871.1 pyruvate carboxylase subunit B [SAR202 cluster bacterium]MQG59075.1 pyruvate carboxylase subunit B [SAR202 cluster bacterium]|tara:strand:- start:10644 stop:12512 length:1869 start_codon:yes stop_codon:yes gene_type:complete
MTANPIKITDTTFRDAHQSLMATRLRIEDMEPLAAKIDAIGFHSAEVWGGATFDSATRFLAEDPWDRLRTFNRLMPNTPLMMLLRGQSLVGYRTYADDVVDSFVERSAENGIDIFRVFDALNHEPNLQRAAAAVKRSGKHLQMAICYSLTAEGRLGGPIYNLDYYVDRAKRFVDLGADSICLKDMGGLMAPYDAHELITALKEFLDVPIQLHTHYTSGMASMTALKAVEAGIDVIDTCLSPLALRTSQPAIEPLVVTLGNTERDPGLDLASLLEISDELETILPRYRAQLQTPKAAVIDANVLSHQIPGGMASNLVSQLREAGALDRLNDVLTEIPRTRAELGFPPLVTPMSQMVGSQAVSNVLFGRYSMLSEPVKDYIRGAFGEAPSEINAALRSKIAEEDGGSIIMAPTRPADALAPELGEARDAVAEISEDIDDVLIYALYPQTGLRFLKIKHGLEPLPDEMKSKTLEQVELETVAAAQSSSGAAAEAPLPSARARRFNVYVGDQFFEVDVDPVEVNVPGRQPGTSVAPPATSVAPAPPSAAPAAVDGETSLLAPMPGIIVKYSVEVGQQVAAGEPVVVLEAMKMQNVLPAPVGGIVKALGVSPGAQVDKDDVLATIAS